MKPTIEAFEGPEGLVFRVREPEGWNGKAPEDQVLNMAQRALFGKSIVTTPMAPRSIPTPEERTAARIAVISRQVMNEKQFRLALANEGLPTDVPWVELTAEEKQARLEIRQRRERDALAQKVSS